MGPPTERRRGDRRRRSPGSGRRASRRGFLRTAAAAGAVGLAGCNSSSEPGATGTASPSGDDADDGADADPTATTPDASLPDAVGLEPVVTDLRAPVDVAFAPEADRRYVLEQAGRVLLHGPDGLREESFLNIRDDVTAGGERGFLGLAVHPEFGENRRLFARYSSPPRPGTPESYNHTFVLSEFAVNDEGTRALPDSERTVLEIPQPQGNHNAGSIAFGPDGFLYVGVGDGGGGGDRGPGHVEDWYDAVEGGNGQDVTENLLGSLLRIDVDAEPTEPARDGDGDEPDEAGYAIPDDNPLVGAEGFDEHYAWGFRNPWRLAFDGEDLYVGDVGQDRYEEVDLVERGGNYGWNVTEGIHCYRADDCPDRTPDDVRGGEPLIDPIVEYPNRSPTEGEVSGISIIGGQVYRGSSLPGLEGTYVFGDLQPAGRLFVATRPDDEGLWPTQVVRFADGDDLERLLAFGRDRDGELYVLGGGSEGDGGVYRIVPAE